MKNDINKEEKDQTEIIEEIVDLKDPAPKNYNFGRIGKIHVLANPNRSIGKGMNATHQTKKPHKPRKGK